MRTTSPTTVIAGAGATRPPRRCAQGRGDGALVGRRLSERKTRVVLDRWLFGRRIDRRLVGLLRVGRTRADTHQEDERPGRRRQRGPVDGALGPGRVLVPGDERDLCRDTALRHRDTGIRGHGMGGAHAGDDLEGDPGPLECQRLLAPAAKHERVAALQANDGLEAAAELDEECVQALLGHGVLTRALAGVDPLGGVGASSTMRGSARRS